MHFQNEIEEVIPLIIKTYFVRDYPTKKLGFTGTTIHKILFKLKKELPKNEYIQEILPYYWYFHGPYCEVISQSIEKLKSDKSLIKKDDVLFLNYEKVRKEDYDLDDEPAKKVKSILKHFNPANSSPFIEKIYKSYAPWPFIPAFKIDFLKALVGYESNLSSGKNSLDYYSESSVLRDALFECETELLPHALFDKFNTLFSSFVTDALRVFKYVKEVDNNVSLSNKILNLNKVSNMAEFSVWNTFAYGIRIIEHDEPYAGEERKWKNEYAKRLSALSPQIRIFSADILSNVRGTLSYSFDDKSREFLSTVMRGYLS